MVTNRVPRLVEALEQLDSRKSTEQFITLASHAIWRRVMSRLVKNQPVGKNEPSYETKKGRIIDHGRPSWRIWGAHNDIGSSWIEPGIFVHGNTGEVVISSKAPHIAIVMDGTKKHGYTIPGEGNRSILSFFHLKTNEPVITRRVKHPGSYGNPFVDVSIEEARPQNLADLRTEMKKVMRPVRSVLS